MPGSTLTTAQNIGVLTSFNYNDAIENTNPVDYYKFSLTGTNNINLVLSGLTQNYFYAKIYYDQNNNGLIDSGEQLYSTDLAGVNSNGQLTATLGAGTYYVGVEQYSNNANSNYSLQLSATSTPGSTAADPGSTFSTAYNIGNLTGTQTFTEFVGNVDPLDYYKFSLTGTNDINLVLSGLTQNYFYAKIYYDKNNNGLIDSGEQLYSTDLAGVNSNGQLTATLGAGTYYVGVEQYSNNANSNYSLQLSATSTPGSTAADPGSTFSTAYNIGNLTGTQTFTEFVGNVDPLDYYKFSLTGTNNINLVLSGLTQNYFYAKIYYDQNNNGSIDSGEQLYSTDLAGVNSNGQLTATLGAGTYYVGVEQYSNNANSNYSLQLSATSTPGSTAADPGSTFSTAYNIGNLTGTQTFTEFVGNVDPLDYYKFSLTGTNNINLVLSGLTQNYFYAKIYYDQNNNGSIDSGEQLYSTDLAGVNSNGQLTATLGAGTYYVGVEQYSNNANSNYSLQLSATSTPGSTAADPGSTFSTAYNIGNLTGTQTFTEFVGNVDPLDYYKFSLTGTNDINLVLSGLTQNYFYAKIYYDKNNNGLIDSGEQLYSTDLAGVNSNGQLTATLGAGTYYVGVEQYSNNANSNYSLQLSATSTPGSTAADPGSTFSTAYNIGNLTGTQTFTEFVGNVDPLDYYKFSLTGTNNINLVLSGLTQNYFYAKIYYDQNNNGSIDSGEQLYSTDLAGVNSNGQLTATLGAGTYYVGVEQYSNNANSNYSLTLVNITNPNPSITLAASSASVLEDGTANLVYTFTRSGSTTNALTVNFGVAGTATFNTDYTQSGAASFTGTTGSITFAAGSSTATLTIDSIADTTFESNETVALTLATGTDYTIGTTTAVSSTITNDDTSSITINLSANQTIVEGLTSPQNTAYTVSLSQASSQTITVQYATANGTATVDSDYTNTAGTLTFNPGDTSKVINIPILNDAINEANETFTLNLTSPTNASLGTTNTVTTTITDTLTASVTTTLPTNVENLTLTGTTAINGTGNAGNNILKGNSANNTLAGGDGNDTYSFVANTALGTDTITEIATGGTDTIDFGGTTVAVKVSLGVTTSQTVNTNLKLILSTNNVIENATGGTGNDRLTGNALNNILSGGNGNDQLQGLAGDDTLWGGLGDDILTGGAGKDKYLFQSSGVFSSSLGVDYISQFEVGQDQIVLSKATFNAITNSAGQPLTDFAVVTDNEFVDASNARIVFSQSTGSLFYNQNGNVLGTTAVFEFATLGNPDITLSASDFSIVA